MTLCKACLAITLLMFAGNTVAINEVDEVDTGDCMYNCSTMVEIGQTYYVVARGADGEIFHLENTSVETEGTTLIGSDEIAINSHVIMNNSASSFASSSSTSFASSSGTGSTVVHTKKYETDTHWIVVVTIEYYDDDGNLVDIDVFKSKVPKPSLDPDFGDT